MTRSRATADTQDNNGGSVPPFVGAKNRILNGDFAINQRNFSSTTSSGVYTFDRWSQNCVDGTVTTSAQTFTLGTAPVVGYEARNFIRQQTTGQTLANTVGLIYQPIESVRTFANQTVTISFWAKAASGTPKVAVEINQVFGTGGSPSASVQTLFGQVTLSTSWTRYSVTATIPSISGKTLGTNNNDSANLVLWTSAGSDFNARTGSLGIQTNTFDFWGVQVEAGSVATPFTTATGTIQGELAACQRYYYENVKVASRFFAFGQCYSTTQAFGVFQFPVPMRATPSITYSASGDFDLYNTTGTKLAVSTMTAQDITSENFRMNGVTTGLVAGNATAFTDDGGAVAAIKVSAEL